MIYKPQALHSRIKYATIVKHGRKVGGGFGVLHDLFWREEEPWVVLKLPTGARVAVRAAQTDLPTEMFSTTEGHREASAPMLLEMAAFCRHLNGRSRRRGMHAISKKPTSK